MAFVNRLTFLGISRAGGCMGTMAFAGALPVLRAQWHMDAASAGSIQTAFNLANACALLAAAWLSDSVGTRRMYLFCSWAGALAMAVFALFARSPDSARVLIVLVGLTQGGCYATALLLAAEFSSPAQRGQALGQILAAGSFGYLVSILTSYSATATYGPQTGFGICAAGTLLGAIVSQATLPAPAGRGRPAPREHTGIPWREIFSPVAICLLIGYVAHCWELLGYWAWTPALLTMVLSPYRLDAVSSGFIIASVIHLSGMLATAFIGRLSDRWPRSLVLIIIGGAGAMSSALLGWSPALAGPWPLVCAAAGSFFILGDSGVLSAAMTDEVAPGNLGKVMGLRSLLGFGAGALAPVAFGVTLDTTRHWGWAYLTLAAGGAGACIAAIYLYLIKR